MLLHALPKTSNKKKKRIGRGTGSGRGKTAGRGTKGEKARGRMKLGFEGGQLPLIKRLPYKKGFKVITKKRMVINVGSFNFLSDGYEINFEKLTSLGFIPHSWNGEVKILGDGKLEKKLIIKGISCSSGAIEKIKAAGGEVNG